jgi:Gpi18-like mannosyltransferase
MVTRARPTRRLPVVPKDRVAPPLQRVRESYGPVVQRFGRWSTHPVGQIWLDALFAWSLTRALFLALTYLAPAGSTPARGIVGPLRNWFAQDGSQFIYIAEHGYDQWWRTAYFPLFPLLEHLLAPLFSGDAGLAGMVIANASFLGALVVLRDLVGREFDTDVARRTILYLAIFPTAFFYFAPYSESLSLLLSLGAFSALRQRHWWLGGLLGGVAALARPEAVILLIPFAVEIAMACRYGLARWWQALWAALIPAGIGIYSIYLSVLFHNPLEFWVARTYWTRSFQWPWQGFVETIATLPTAGRHGSVDLTHLILYLVAALAFIVLATLVLRSLPLSYGLYTVALLLFILLFLPAYGPDTLQSSGRSVGTLFAAFIVLAHWGRHPHLHELFIFAQAALLTLLAFYFLDAAAWGNVAVWWA